MPTRSPFYRKRALVLGASGFIGYWLARALRAQGAHVTCAVRSHEAAERLTREQLGHVVVRRDLSALDDLAAWIPALHPAVVFNLAGYGVDRSERDDSLADLINHRLVGALARVVSTLPHDEWIGLRLLHVGSALEYGTTGGVLSEDSVCAPTTVYGCTKLDGTRALQGVVRETGLDACIARLFTVYGPLEHPGRLLPSVLDAARSGEPLLLSDGQQRRDFVYVEEVVEGLLRLAVSDVRPGEIVNLATGVMHSVRDFVQTAASVVKLEPSSLRFGALPQRPDEMSHEGVSISRLRARAGWVPADDITEGVARTIGRLAESAHRASQNRHA
jgi:nucleoside-diphosphate-sugar epimerase